MKKVYITLIISLIAFSLTAQNRQVQERGFMGANPAKLGPNFTTEQAEAIKATRFEFQKEMVLVNNQIAEKRAQLKTLQQVDKPDMRSINSKIDEITTLQNKRMKAAAANQAKIRSLLTDEQRVMFDKRMGQRGDAKQKGMRSQKMMNSHKMMQINRGAQQPGVYQKEIIKRGAKPVND
ncbi:MAG: hypothetical protein Q8R90_04530 [Bacteroidales bacterium]|jgi:Spy/CpxP family protein refolding chaperone|nr:hypothetical protein [Bacteroidales bacterium]